MVADMPPAIVEEVPWGDSFYKEDSSGWIPGHQLRKAKGIRKADIRFRYGRNFIIGGSYAYRYGVIGSESWIGSLAYNRPDSPYEIYISLRNANSTTIGLPGNYRLKGLEAGGSYAFTPYLIGSASMFYGYEDETERNVRGGRVELSLLF